MRKAFARLAGATWPSLTSKSGSLAAQREATIKELWAGIASLKAALPSQPTPPVPPRPRTLPVDALILDLGEVGPSGPPTVLSPLRNMPSTSQVLDMVEAFLSDSEHDAIRAEIKHTEVTCAAAEGIVSFGLVRQQMPSHLQELLSRLHRARPFAARREALETGGKRRAEVLTQACGRPCCRRGISCDCARAGRCLRGCPP